MVDYSKMSSKTDLVQTKITCVITCLIVLLPGILVTELFFQPEEILHDINICIYAPELNDILCSDELYVSGMQEIYDEVVLVLAVVTTITVIGFIVCAVGFATASTSIYYTYRTSKLNAIFGFKFGKPVKKDQTQLILD